VSCTIDVTFTPTATGKRTGFISLTDDGPHSPHTAALSGTGTNFSVAAAPSAQTVKTGKVGTYTLTLTPNSGFTGTVLLSCSGAPPKASCTISPSSVALNGVSTSAATVKVNTAPGKNCTPKNTYSLARRLPKSEVIAGKQLKKLVT